MPRLSPEQLCRACDADALGFETTAELEDLDASLGQERAVDALNFALDMGHDGYDVFVLGRTGTGRHHLVLRLLGARAAEGPVADDWCYVRVPDRPEAPRALRLPAGRGAALRDGVARLLDELAAAVPAAFEADAYRTARAALERRLAARREEVFGKVQEHAAAKGVALLQGENSLAIAPLKDGKPVPTEEVAALPEAERAAMDAAVEEVRGELEAALRQIPRWVSEQREALRGLDRRTTEDAVEHLVEALRARFVDLPEVTAHLDALTADLVEQAVRFREGAPDGGFLSDPAWRRQFEVNLLVDRSADRGAPLVYEDNPTLQNLVGRVDHQVRMGNLVTDALLVRAGALHRANGGTLVLDADRVLRHPMAWEHLERALRSKEVRIESLSQALNLVSTSSLEPEPIPLDVKVVLLGDRRLYYLLSALDPEFGLLFKVPADVQDRMDRTPDAVASYARLVATLARADGLLAFDRHAVARVIVEASRLADDGDKLSTHLDSLTDLLREADHHARRAGRKVVGAEDVRTAVDQARRRHGRVRDELLEQTVRGTLRIETDGAVVGQVNGLTVVPLGKATFGRPSRISARARLGRGQVVDIEREVELGGPLHAKGVLVLTGFVSGRYAHEHPLALAATLVLEQSYGPVDGDSASLAETVALLSALSGLPVRQDVAVTGSIDQHGRVQAVGGVNDKVEGFFDLCAARGLSGRQGVILPAANAPHLVLREDVVAAAREDRFHVWTVETVDEALALLMGHEAGARDADGAWTPGSVNALVEARLVAFAERAIALASGIGDLKGA